MYRLPTVIWISRIPPRLRLAKKTLMIAYAIRMMQNRIMNPLVILPKPRNGPDVKSVSDSTALNSCMISLATSPMDAP